jgi:DNA helicase-2/ATP-dependent DNA helicase PcrA
LNVLSVHRAKGLEWDTVYIVDCSEGSFPLRKQSSGLELPNELKAGSTAADEHLAEERRLMYVAVTRARRELIVSHADKHGSNTVRKPSRFLSEMFGDNESPLAPEKEGEAKLERFAPLVDSRALELLPPAMLDSAGQLTLNVSQISCWLDCPEDFRYKYVLNMPLPPAPQLAYGTLIHSMIERLHRGRSEGTVPDVAELEQYVMDGLPRIGYASKRSRERAHVQAKQTIRRLYERFTHDQLPLESETPFRLALPDIGLTITGRIDAVYKAGDGVEIRDYKTGTSVDTPEKAKSRATGSHQLTLYALAWRELHGTMPALLSLDFVETGLVGSVKKQAKSLDTLMSKLADMATDIKAGHYPPGARHDTCAHP